MYQGFKESVYYGNPGGGPGGGSGHGSGVDLTMAGGASADITGNATGDAGLSGGTGTPINRVITSDAAPGDDAGALDDEAGREGTMAHLMDVGRTNTDIVDVGDPIVELGGGPDDAEDETAPSP